MAGKERHYNIAIVGLGHRGYKTHFQNISNSRSEAVVAVCDANATALATFSKKHPDIPAYPSLDMLIRHHHPDFAVVCVPHKFHMDCVTLLANAGIPVLKEKPAASSMEEYEELSKMPIKIGVTFQKRFEPRFYQFEKLLPQVGHIASFRATLSKSIQDLESTWRAADGVGVTEDLGCHMLDQITWLFGKPSTLTANSASSVRTFQEYSGDDVSDVIMKWDATGVIGHVHLSRVSSSDEEKLIVTGTSGTLSLADNKVILQDPAGTQIFEMTDTATKRTIVRDMLRKFGDYATGRTDTYPSSLDRLKDTVAVLEATLKSFETGMTETLDLSARNPTSSSLKGNHFVWPMITPGIEKATIDQMHSSLSVYNRSNIYETFEDRWRNMHNLKHALVCNSGTIAILHMFEALNLRPGDEILCPVYTFFATATPMLQYGAVPIFCDALPDGNIDPAEIARRATPRTKAVIVTHMWGLPCRMSEIVAEARKVNGTGIKVLEDCSHAHGAMVDGKLVGSWGDMAAWSLQAQKNITGGQAGVFATDSTDYYAHAVTHGHFNKRAKQEVPEDHPLRKFWLTGLGLNLRAHPLAIAMANRQLDSMPLYMECREKHAKMLAERLGWIPFLQMPKIKDARKDRHAWYAFVMQFDESKAPEGLTREKFVDALLAEGLQQVDIPGSTKPMNNIPLFVSPHEAIPRFGDQPWLTPQADSEFKNAYTFYDKAIKLPVWATPGDGVIVKHYADGFERVAQRLMEQQQPSRREGDRPSSPSFGKWQENQPLMAQAKL